MTAAEELLSEGFEPACNLYIASGHNEEVFGDGIHEAVKYFEEQGIEFELAIDEGGGVIGAPINGIDCKCAMIAVHEKGYHRMNVRAVQGDTEGFVLTDNPVTRVSKFIAEVSSLKLTVKMPAQVREMFTSLMPYMSFPLRFIFANLWCFEPLLVKLMPKINGQAAAMLGTTCSFGSIESKKGETPRDNECSASALIRYIDEADLEADMEKIRALAKKYSLEITEPADGHEFHRPADTGSKAFEYVCRCARKTFPHAAVAPFVLAAGTDARWLCDVCPCTPALCADRHRQSAVQQRPQRRRKYRPCRHRRGDRVLQRGHRELQIKDFAYQNAPSDTKMREVRFVFTKRQLSAAPIHIVCILMQNTGICIA